MNLVIDVGNTRIKAAVFEDDTLKKVMVFPHSELLKNSKEIIKRYKVDSGIISSVATIDEVMLNELKDLLPILELNSTTKVPFINNYETPKSLGVDRIASMANAVVKYPNKNVLVIDAGTCITYDFVNSEKEYFGGVISLGVEMRYKALNTFTSKLPLLEKKQFPEMTGSSTEASMHSGVINAILLEVNGFIAHYEKKNTFLTLVLTGGDTNFLAKQLKSSIFANPNFVLEGLNAILTHNK